MNLIGRKFGRLEVMGTASRKGYALCRCECGKIKEIRTYDITSGATTSCGCYQKEVMSAIGKRCIKENSKERLERIRKYGTNITRISNPNPNKNNNTGYKGVWHDSKRDVYVAKIMFRKKSYYLGTYKKLEEAVNARQAAENELFTPVIEEALAEMAVS